MWTVFVLKMSRLFPFSFRFCDCCQNVDKDLIAGTAYGFSWFYRTDMERKQYVLHWSIDN